jgi:hypothetical protein
MSAGPEALPADIETLQAALVVAVWSINARGSFDGLTSPEPSVRVRFTPQTDINRPVRFVPRAVIP